MGIPLAAAAFREVESGWIRRRTDCWAPLRPRLVGTDRQAVPGRAEVALPRYTLWMELARRERRRLRRRCRRTRTNILTISSPTSSLAARVRL